MTKTVKCLECLKLSPLTKIDSFQSDKETENSIIIPDDAVVGDIFECPICGAELELISVNPLQVAVIAEEK